MWITNVRFIKGRSKMKKLKKQWNKVTVLLLTFGIVFGLFGAVPVQAQDAVSYAKKEAAALKAEGCDVVIALPIRLNQGLPLLLFRRCLYDIFIVCLTGSSFILHDQETDRLD